MVSVVSMATKATACSRLALSDGFKPRLPSDGRDEQMDDKLRTRKRRKMQLKDIHVDEVKKVQH